MVAKLDSLEALVEDASVVDCVRIVSKLQFFEEIFDPCSESSLTAVLISALHPVRLLLL